MRVSLRLLTVLSLLTIAGLVWAYSSGPPAGVSGAPGEGTCADAGCHDDFLVNSGPGSLTVTHLPSDWNGDFQISVNIQQPGMIRWGFQASAIRPNGEPDSGLLIVDSARTILSGTTQHPYVSHNAAGTDSGTVDIAPGWKFWWLMSYPLSQDSAKYFYVAAVAANGDGTRAGDYVYTTVHLLRPAIVECPLFGMLDGDVNLDYRVSSADIIYLVGYVFRGGPPPAECTENGDVNCNGSVNSTDILYLVNFVFKGGYPPCDPCSIYGPLDFTCN